MFQLYHSYWIFSKSSLVFSQDSVVVAAWTRGTSGYFFPLVETETNFRRVKYTPLSWTVLVSKSLYNRAKFITKYCIVRLREKFLEFILAISKETYFSILLEKIPPLYYANYELSYFYFYFLRN